ncbi:uncharacterized protein LOC143299066 isoform X4 [Babylonia areolata]|uniref:uncharacterized protein LOC143299066 isoform X4 n=1 Tax=Babylonia areolata TaxID=304850 RepID=UPI003FD4B4C6
MASQSHHTLPGPGEGGGGGGGGGGGKRRSFLPAPTKRTSGIPTPSSSSVLTPSPSISAPPLSSQVPAPPSATAQPPGRSLKASSGEAPPRGGPARDDEVSNKPPVEVIPGAEKLRVGERILISGVKPGILRFVGRTHIAPGFWCGIELHDASGLHDGEVDGQRYFTCKPFRGIFAPVDKVGPDETQPKVVLPPSLACAAEEKRTQLPSGQSKHSENMECSGKPGSAGKSGSGSGSGKYQGSRLAGVFRRGAESPDKGGGGEPSCKASAYNRRSFGGVGEQDRDGGSYYKSRMSSSYSDYHDHHRHQQESARAGSEEAEGYSSHVKEHLQSDSRRYFNLTFGRDTPPYLTNLPDLLSSVNPPSPKEDAAAEAGQQPHGGAVRSVSDVHLSFKEGGMEEDSGGFLLESSPPGAGRGVPSASESDASLSGQSSTLEDASVATVSEVPRAAADLPPTTTKAPGPSSGEDGKLVEASDRCRSRSPAAVTHGGMARTGGQGGEQRKEDDPRQTARHHHHHHQRAGSTSGAGGGTREGRVVVMEEGGGQEDGSNEVSPEVSQVLEWDYDHDAFDGSAGVPLRAVAVVGQDLNREDVAILDDRDSLEKQLFDGESEESEEGDDDDEDEEEEEEETSEEEEEETTSEEEEESSEEEEEESEEESDDGESEDDRIEADRNAPNARNSAKGGQEGRVAVPVAGGENLAMAGSAVVSSEMTESSDTVSLSQKQGHDSTTTTTATTTTSTEGAPPKPQPTTTSSSSTSQKPDHPASSTTTTTTSAGPSKKPKKKPKSTPNSAEDKKIVAEHKKAIKKASSRLADYIKAPLPPPKPKEEKPDARSSKKNKDKKSSSSSSKAKKKQDKADKEKKKKKAAGNKDEEEEKKEEKKERRQPRVREEKPKVKRTVVKSKWGNIMSQIEASKQTVKIKPKTEIQSSLALYLSTPAPPNPNKKEDSPEGGKEGSPHPNQPTSIKAPSKPKPKLIKHPKPDFSNIKSKLNITPPPPLPRRDSNANNSGGNLKSPNTTPKGSCSSNKGSLPGSPKDPGGKASEGARSRTNVSRKPPVPKFNSKEFAEREAAQSQGTGSCSSLTGVDGNAVSRAGARLRSDRGSSVTSTKSDNSATQRSVKSMNQRNVQKTEQAASGSDPADSRKTPVKSSSLPPSGSKKAVGEGGGGGGGARPTTTTTTTTSSTTSTPSRPARGSGATRKGSVDHHQQQPRPPSGPRAALQGGLKSGHPPDVVSTSARGPRAQEVARLESLCEARTKELGLARAQLRSGVQAFDAMACLLNYCTTELDAFSCPVISAKLKKATDTLGQQQQSLDQLTQEKSVAEQQLQETRAARDAARQEVEQLREEMRTAADTHGAAQQRLQEEQAAALRALREEISSQHQDTLQKMQQYQENQAEYNRQSHRRQLVEVTSEHQMATNQLKVAHLEEIQELRNKHELQVEELHAQHRKKLEDITERFESIKLSLTEKVQSLCSECDDLRIRAKTSEDALQRDSDVKVQLALTPYLHLPQEIESLKTVIDMRTEEIQKLKRQNMDLVKQLEELPIAQEKVVSLKQKVENLQAIINIKTDHEKQLHEKCQVLMRKYDRESRAKKRLSMDYEQVVWRMSQSADLGGSSESVGAGASPRQLSRSPSRGSQHSPHGASPVRSLSSSSGQGADSNGGGVGVVRRQRKTSGGGGEEADQRRRANTFSSDTPRHRHVKRDDGDGDDGLSGPASLGYVSTTSSSSTGKRRVLSKSGDYSELVSVAAARERERREREREREQHEESFSSGHESGDTSDFFSSLESNVILETAQGVSFQLLDKAEAGGGGGGGAPPPSYPQPTPAQDEVFAEEMVVLHAIQDMSPPEEVTTSSSSSSHTITTTTTTTPTQVKDTDRQAEVTVVVTTASSQ